MSSAVRAFLLGAALVLAGCTTVPPAVPPAEPAEAAELADFRRLVFGPGDPRPGREHLAKWQQPVRAAVIDAGDEHQRQAVRRHLQDLATLTGLAVAESPRESANLLIFFAADPAEAARRHRGLYAHRVPDARSFDNMLAARADSTCFGFLWGGWPSGRGIDFAVVFIRTDRGERTMQGCLVQQTTQVMGLLHDLDPDADSIFSDSGRQVALTERDRLLLRLLYDPRLKPGMGWAEAEPSARTALQDLRRELPQ